ncbi:lasso peptide biosynthesis PqqD family chaperone [Kineococcus sp. SYSU DK002]|uniref:lasso peptide biosynthesis PqqD family chaperone n=1 Tax=Kineococcus sp. SYSU DK002 TaxID=3383123 RepID=UPI003D7EA8D5
MNPTTNPGHALSVSTEYGDVVLDETNGKYWHLNATASLVLAVHRRGGSAEQAVTELTSAYDVDEATARADVTAFLTRFDALGLT